MYEAKLSKQRVSTPGRSKGTERSVEDLLTRLSSNGYKAVFKPRLRKIDITWSEWDSDNQVVVPLTVRINPTDEAVSYFLSASSSLHPSGVEGN